MNKLVVASFIAVMAVGCSGSDGADGAAALTSVVDEPAGANCELGGVLFRAGNDDNGNGILDSGEETGGTYLCAGADGVPYLTRTSEEAAGANCAAGGARIDVGADGDRSGTLEEGEVVATEYVCDGEDGSEGPAGAEALVALADEPAGANCVGGGVRVESGTDLNGDGVLDPGEVTGTRYACDGTSVNAELFNSFDPGVVYARNGEVTAGSITFDASGPGRAYVFGSVDAFCVGSVECGPNGSTSGAVSIQDGLQSASSGSHSFFALTENRTENVSRSAVFNVTSAGPTTYNLRASASPFTVIGFFRPQLTVIFFAD